jgi:Ca2+-binding EF-hand superfamily protein
MEPEEFIDFSSIRGQYSYDSNLFSSYLKEVYKDLADRAESNKKKGISKITFLDYIKLPVFIGEKLFNSLDLDSDGYLNSKEFIEGLVKVYMGDFEQSLEIIFNTFDFDKDGVINKADVKLLLSYLPLKTEKSKVEYKFQMESLEEINEVLKHTFHNDKETMKLDEFIKAIEYKKSDVFLQLLCFLLQKKPFNDDNVKMLKLSRRASHEVSPTNSPSPKRIPSPNRKSLFLPSILFLNSASKMKKVRRTSSNPPNSKTLLKSFHLLKTLLKLPVTTC